MAIAQIERFEVIEEYIMRNIEERNLEILRDILSNINLPSDTINTISHLQINITRFGIVAIILFAVSICLGIYRLERRLSIYYSARADALSLLDGIELPIDIIVPFITTPPSVNFGRTPRHAMESIGEIAQKLPNTQRSR